MRDPEQPDWFSSMSADGQERAFKALKAAMVRPNRLTFLVGKRIRGESMTPGQWRELEVLERREKRKAATPPPEP